MVEGGAFDRMLHSLGRNIVLGTVEPGTALDPIALGEQFGVSRTVVREVFRALGSKGLVDARPRRGTTVSARSRWQMLDGDVLRWRFSHGADVRFLDQVFDLRLAVEPLAARRAATEHVEADLAGLTEALRAMRSAASPEEHIAADLSFHRAVLRAAHNELLESLAPLVEGGLRERDRLVHAAITADAVQEHAAVVAAIGRRDGAAAEAAMRALLSRSAADVTRAMTSVAGEQV